MVKSVALPKRWILIVLAIAVVLASTVVVFNPAPAQAGKVANGIWWAMPGDSAYTYIIYVRPMAGSQGGIEVYLTSSGQNYALQEIGALRLAIWSLNAYYQAGGSKTDFPYTSEYVQSLANEIRLHALYCWYPGANPVNIEKVDHPGYKVSTWQMWTDMKNGVL